MRNGSCRHVLSVRRPCPLALPGVIRKHPSHHDMLRPLCNHCVVMLRPLLRPPRGPYNGLNSAIFETFYKVVLQWPLHGLQNSMQYTTYSLQHSIPHTSLLTPSTCAPLTGPSKSHTVYNIQHTTQHTAYIASDALDVCTAPCLLYTSPSPRDDELSRMPSSA